MKRTVFSVFECLVLLFFCSCSETIVDLEDLLTDSVWTERAAQITEGCTTDYEKAKAIYEWECANIAYDLDFKIVSAEECWDQRKGVCHAYSELFVKLATHCGLEATLLSGKARTSNALDGEASHAWVKVHAEKGWMLCDPTWGAGAVSMDHTEYNFNEYNMSMSWFDADPEIVVFTHFPKDKKDQFLEEPLTADQYRYLPDIPPAVVSAGWRAHDVLDYFLSHPGESAPLFYAGFYNHLGEFELVQMPYHGTMRVGETYVLKIKSLALEEGVAIGSWETNHYLESWEQEGDLFTCVYTPETEGEFYISLHEHGGIMRGIMKYDVK